MEAPTTELPRVIVAGVVIGLMVAIVIAIVAAVAIAHTRHHQEDQP